MKKFSLLVLLSLLVCAPSVLAEDAATPALDTTVSDAVVSQTTTADTATAGEPTSPTPESIEAAPDLVSPIIPAPEVAPAENLEFVSGEVSSVDEAAKTLTVKVYGESEENATEKILTVQVDDTTDITDGEKDRDLKSLTPSTEVDIEYDAASSKATYIFVY